MLFSFLFLICALFGCQKNPPASSATQVSINVIDEPQGLDPRKVRDLSGSTIAKMLFEGLTRINAQDVPELALAEAVDLAADLKTYTFHLRKSTWSNGDPVTAHDFVYAWKSALSPLFPSDTAFLLYGIKNAKAAKEGKVALDEVGIAALNDSTLQVHLENPAPYFLELLAFPIFFPVNQKIDETNPQWALDTAQFVGNGPFRWKEWKHQDHLTLEKNPAYWDAQAVHLDQLVLCMVKEETELSMFEKKELDWAGSPLSILPIEALGALRKSAQLKTKEILGTTFIRVNTARAPLDQPELRRAFALAMNRGLIVEHVTQGNQIPATGLVPLSLKVQSAPYFADGDVNSAKSLLQQCSLSEMRPIVLTYRATERNHMMAQAIQEQWRAALGIQVQLESLEGKVYFDRVSKQNFDLALGNWMADFADPINFLEVFKYDRGSNNTHWENPAYAALLDQSALEIDPEARRQLFAQAEKILIEEMPIIPIFYSTMLYVNQPQLKDVVLSSMGGIDFKWASSSKGEIK